MRNVIAIVDAHLVVRAAAAESNAFELFVAAANDITARDEEHTSSRVELAQLAARKQALIDDLNLMTTRLHATAVRHPTSAPALASFGPLSTRLFTRSSPREPAPSST